MLVSRLFGQCLSVHHRQDLDRRVVVVQHVALGRLADQFLEDRFGTLGLVRNDIPLSRGGQGNAQALLQRFVAVHRHPRPISQQGDHAADGRVALLVARTRRQVRRKDRAAKIAAELLQIIDLGAYGSLADQPHHHAWTVRLVNGSRFALRAGIARLKRGVRDFDLLGGRVSVGPVAAVPRVSLGCWTWLRQRRSLRIVPGLGTGVACRTSLQGIFSCGSIARGQCRLRRVLNALRRTLSDDHRRLLGLRAEEQFPQPRDGRILVAHGMEQPHIGFDHGMDRGVVFRVEILSLDALEKVFQLAHVQLDDSRIGEDHDSVPRRPAKSPTRPSDEGGGGFSCRRSIRRRTIPKSAEIGKINSLQFRA